jgi:hypothetical protein
MATITKTEFPFTGPYSVTGANGAKVKGNTALALKRAMSRMGHLPWAPDVWDNIFNAKLEAALDKWDPGKDGYGTGRYDKLRSAVIPAGLPNAGANALDATCINQVQVEFAAGQGTGASGKVPALGPMEKGGTSLLDFAPSHPTTGIDRFPAVDTVWVKGTVVIAPEKMKVYKSSSSRPGDACYLEGDSGIRYWMAHLVSAPAVGAVILKGGKVGVVGSFSGYTPHLHCGINVEKLWGAGKELKHGLHYSAAGIPTIRTQFQNH